MSLSKLLDKIREQNMVKSLPQPKTRPETDEEFKYRAFHTPFYCGDCGSQVYPEWNPTIFNRETGEPYHWDNVQPCPKCGKVSDGNMRQAWAFNDEDYIWNGFFSIYRKRIMIEDQTQTHHSDV